jgi:hypothetical protein
MSSLTCYVYGLEWVGPHIHSLRTTSAFSFSKRTDQYIPFYYKSIRFNWYVNTFVDLNPYVLNFTQMLCDLCDEPLIKEVYRYSFSFNTPWTRQKSFINLFYVKIYSIIYECESTWHLYNPNYLNLNQKLITSAPTINIHRATGP